MLTLVNTIAIQTVLTGMRAYDAYLTASDIYNGEWETLAQDMVVSLVGGKIMSAIYDKLSQYQFMQRMGQRFQNAIDRLRCIFNSFDGTTLVATENGLIPIAEIKIGDKVWAYNEANQSKSLQEVTHLIRGKGDKELVNIKLSSGEVITATSNHPFWEVDTRAWTDAGKLTADSILLNINEKNSTISSVRDYTQSTTVYNLTVANDHTYFVGVGGVLGHNSGCKLKPEKGYLGSKKHGIDWKEGPARAKKENIPQGQWGSKKDLEFAGDKAGTLKEGESAWFDLPEGHTSIVHLPNGITVKATKIWVKNKGTGTFHGYPAQ